MKNLTHKQNEQHEVEPLTASERLEELTTQGYQRRFFNRSPLVVELASALDQALAEIEPTLTDEDDLDQNESSDLASPFVQDERNETGTGV